MQLCAVDLVGFLADGHFQKQGVQAGAGGQSRHHRRIDAAGHAHHKAFGARALGIAFQPLGNVLDHGLGLHGVSFRRLGGADELSTNPNIARFAAV